MKPDYSARKRGMPTMSIEERLKSNMKVNPVSGCWEWTGCKRGGYGHTIVGILADQSEDAYNRTHAPRSWERALSAMRDYLEDSPTIIPADQVKEGEE